MKKENQSYISIKDYLDNYTMKGFMIKLRYNPDLKTQIINESKFLPDEASIPERLWYIRNSLFEPQLCPYCKSKRRKFIKANRGLYNTCGSPECLKKLQSKPMTEETKEKMRSTFKKNSLEKYGVDHPMKDKATCHRIMEAYKEKHGTYPINSEKAKRNRIRSMLEKYGTTDMLSIGIDKIYGSRKNLAASRIDLMRNVTIEDRRKKIIQKIKNLKHYELISLDTKNVNIKCKRCGTNFTIDRQVMNYKIRIGKGLCRYCDYKDNTFRSSGEKEVSDSIRLLYDGEIKNNVRFGNHEVDIYIPDKRIAIDFNGLYWHTEQFKEKNYHWMKKHEIEAYNLNFIQIWQDDWENPVKQQIILSRIQSKLGLSKKIYARDTKFSEIDGTAYKKFCDENHLQGHAKASFKFGLLLGSELVEVISFDHPRHAISRTSKDTLGSYELIRLCTKSGYEVVGGFSKLMKHAQEAIPDMKHVKSFIDLDWSSLEMSGYEKVGFKKIRWTDPNYWWCVDGIRMNRLKFTKKNLMKMFPETDMKKSESEIMHDHDWWRIYGSGNLLMEIKYNQK